MVLPHVLTTQILRATYDELGHNGSTRTYIIVQNLYYWKGLKAIVNKHSKQWITSQKTNIQAVKYAQPHFSTLKLPTQFISMDLISPFDLSSSGNHYTLMVIFMLAGYTFCVPLKTKTAMRWSRHT